MKKIIVLIYLIIYTLDISAQGYKKLVVSGNKWNYLSELYVTCENSFNIKSDKTYSVDCGGGESKTYSFYLSKDTTIESIKYFKVICEIIRYNGTVSIYAGAIREDTIEQKVFIRLPDQNEKLLYAFDVQVGDTISIDTSFYKDEVTIRYIKSVGDFSYFNLTGKQVTVCDTVIRTNMTWPPYEIYTDDWFEGIGSMKILFNLQHIDVLESNSSLLCFSNNEEILYSDFRWSICEYAYKVDISELSVHPLVNVFPNPTSYKILIDSKEQIEKIEFYDSAGKLLLATHLFEIDLSDFKNGFYILLISFKSGDRTIKKIIKNAL